VNEWMNEWMNECMDVWKNKEMKKLIVDGEMDGCINEETGKQ